METPEEKLPDRKKFWKEILDLSVFAILIVIPFRIFIAQPFMVDGLSMYPTFNNGNYLIVDEISYKFKEPERGSVLVFRYPKSSHLSFWQKVAKRLKRESYEADRDLIKRVIGLPGETVTLQNGKVTIVSDKYPNGLVLDEPYVKFGKSDTMSRTLADDEYFVMGDNRAASSDSRIWGPVPKAEIVGRPVLSLFPFRILPGDAKYYLDKEVNE